MLQARNTLPRRESSWARGCGWLWALGARHRRAIRLGAERQLLLREPCAGRGQEGRSTRDLFVSDIAAVGKVVGLVIKK